MEISIIIPTYNEAEQIGKLIAFLKNELAGITHEILVADAGSPDGTAMIAEEAGARAVSSEKSRAIQMNTAAAQASGRILYFLHADTFPPAGFAAIIKNAVDGQCDCGCFRLSFDMKHWFLRLNCWFTRFNIKYFRWGDQSLFVTRKAFEESGGFRRELRVMEDQEYMIRLLRQYRFKVLPFSVTTSARKYRENGVIRLQLVFTMLQILYHQGFSQEKILSLYKKLILDKKMNE